MEEPSKLEEVLFTVFMHYSTFCSSSNEKSLKVKDFLLICTEAKVQDSRLTTQKLDLLFRSLSNKSLMNFPLFIKSTLKISELKSFEDFKEDPAEVYAKLIQKNFIPLAEKILIKKEKIVKISQSIPEECIEILRGSLKPLKNFYFKLFSSRGSKKEEILKEAKKKLENFLKELEIFPGFISKKKMDLVWRDLVIGQDDGAIAEKLLPEGFADIGEFFTFSKFLLILYISSALAYADSQFIESPAEKLLCVLERVDLGQDLNNVFNQSSPHDSFLSKTLSQSSLFYYKSEFSSISSVLEEKTFTPNEEKTQNLHSLFLLHACNSSTSNLKQLKPAGFVKLLQRLKVVKKINSRCGGDSIKTMSVAEVDLIFSRVSGAHNLKASFLDYNQFIQAISLVSQRIFPLKSLDESFDMFLSTFVNPLESSLTPKTQKEDSKFLSISAEITEISAILKKTMVYYFRVYSGINFLMNPAGFLRFCKDFEVFPDLLSKARLFYFFSIFAGISKNLEKTISSSRNLNEKLKKDKECCLDEDSFIQVLMIIALNISYEVDIVENTEKICWFFERLSQSPGVEKVLKSYGHARLGKGESFDITSGLRLKFPEFFNRFECKQLKFSDLAASVVLS